ncbi:MAG: serpin family protein [Deltaproteobacteria bacterium]|nr:serpin family protein [Candidatus Anaeroferrophillacea bacterium]
MKSNRMIAVFALLTLVSGILPAAVHAGGVTLEMRRLSYGPGDRMALTCSIDAAGIPAADADVYVAVGTPDASFFCLQPGGGFGAPNTAEPFAPAWPITGIPAVTIFTHDFTAAFPVGNYAWHLILCAAGTDVLQPANWIAGDTLAWEFSAATAGDQELMSDQPRETDPEVTPADLATLTADNSDFAFDLYRHIRDDSGENIFISPVSISIALAMTSAGARADTAAAMAETLRFTLPAERLHPAFNAMDRTLASRGADAAGTDGTPFRLHIVNALWGQDGYHFLPEFLDTLAENYGAGLRLLDFRTRPEDSRLRINAWVEEQTEELITDLLPPGSIDVFTRLVLTNAIYFNAAWQHPFDANATVPDGTFTCLDGSTSTVPMMTGTTFYGYAAGNGWQALELPYDGGEISMAVLLPDAGRYEEFEETLDADLAAAIIADLTATNVHLTIPKFTVEYPLELRETLIAMGMGNAFTGGIADFSGMDGSRELYIGNVVHKAFVTVDEEGTEAAAATAVIMETTAIPAPPVELTLDRPFIFLIRDVETGTILFLGRVTDPGV